MLYSIFILSFLFLIFCAFLFFEKKNHVQMQKKIPIRIHVNGTRGKSSVTRLIHSILAEEGWNVFGKTTGSMPRLLFPDRSEKRIFRNKISIGEQKSFFRFAAKRNAQAIVLECMAVQTHYQKDSEELLIGATHAVITNVRPDHGEWAATLEKIREGFAKTIPKNGVLVYGTSLCNESPEKTLEQNSKTNSGPFFQEIALKNKTETFVAEPKLSRDRIKTAFQSIRYAEHYENVEIAIRVCETLGVTPKSILHGITNAVPDPGALTIFEKEKDGKLQRFVFAFAANDVVSWDQILKSNREEVKEKKEFEIVVFNSKRERPIRTLEFAKFLTNVSELSKIYFFGPWRKLFRSAYAGNAELIFCKENFTPDRKLIFSKSNLWIGAGNYQGPGRIWLENLAAFFAANEEKEWKH
ncbi:poly-gamma-glutamate synthase PgsB [Leptospira alstonii]|uniref:Poly-gamma-glutamate synthase PgsB n=2 Tax=Leptospira alstonii TaxID=28452 RepID=M6CS06_9LEPT|nr:poly-gamma-glutamate synthase PgsB [Leptospira alstonii]EMJ93321.1 poly-gamma-glutamate synthase PgsB [Leptospira alstonii serovar Sichuan str. 79601]EQA82193.1 poly-gamma-glutamate synthase PgsB [Leptospira alstonii serovar Pingchang str. 80-412]